MKLNRIDGIEINNIEMLRLTPTELHSIITWKSITVKELYWLQKNVDVNNEMNFQIQNKIVGELMTYKSIDSVTNQDYVINYPTEFKNSLELPYHFIICN